MVVFSLNSIYNREKNLEYIIPNLVNQVDILYINLIGYPNNYILPKVLKNDKIRITFLESGGSETRFIKYNDCVDDTYYFPVDDDIIYPKNYASYLISKMFHYNNNAVCCIHGSDINLNLDKDFYKTGKTTIHFTKELGEDTKVVIPGVGTSCFYKGNVDINMNDFKHQNMSDPYIATFLYKQKIDVVCVKRGANWLSRFDECGSSIWKNNPYKEIDKLFIEVFKKNIIK